MSITVGRLVENLFALYPAADSAEWDNCGLAAGDPAAEVTGVYITLDPTLLALVEAQVAGANVVLTHHPVFLGQLDSVVAGQDSSGIVFEAVSRGISLVAMHTNLDRSPSVQQLLPGLLSLAYECPLEGCATLEADELPIARYGQVSRADDGEILATLALRVGSALGVAPRVSGDPARAVTTVATATGSAGSLIDDAIAAGADVLVAGEVRYHDALYALGSGLCLIEVGHDVSETCMLSTLYDAVLGMDGVTPGMVTVSSTAPHWWTSI